MKYFFLTLGILVTSIAGYAQNDDFFPELRLFSNIYGKYAPNEHLRVPADTNLIGIWKMREDTDPHNYFVLERFDYNNYVATYMNRGGTNRTYENFGITVSKIAGTYFMSVGYYNREGASGYFFLKMDADSRGFEMTLSLLKDTELKDMTTSKALQERLAKDAADPRLFNKPVHFHKILPLMYCK